MKTFDMFKTAFLCGFGTAAGMVLFDKAFKKYKELKGTKEEKPAAE